MTTELERLAERCERIRSNLVGTVNVLQCEDLECLEMYHDRLASQVVEIAQLLGDTIAALRSRSVRGEG
jgi:hypothetical protein